MFKFPLTYFTQHQSQFNSKRNDVGHDIELRQLKRSHLRVKNRKSMPSLALGPPTKIHIYQYHPQLSSIVPGKPQLRPFLTGILEVGLRDVLTRRTS